MGNDVYRGPSMTDGQGADILPSLAAQMRPPRNRGSRHGAGRRLAEQGGRVSREGTCNQRSAACPASPLAGAQLSQVRRGDRSPTVERSPLAVQKPISTQIAARGGLRRGVVRTSSQET